MILWSGQGYLVAVIIFCASLLMNLIVDGIYGSGSYGAEHWGFATALLIAAVCIWLLGSALQKNEDRVVIDKNTREELVINRSNHSLFFIPMRLWAFPLLAGAVLLLGKTALGI